MKPRFYRLHNILMFGLLASLCACGGALSLMAPAPQLPNTSSARITALVRSTVSFRCRTVDGSEQLTSSAVLGINDLGEIACAVDQGGRAQAYVVRPPYAQGDYTKKTYPRSVGTVVTGLNDKKMVVGFYTDSNGNVSAFAEQNGRWSTYKGRSKTTRFVGVNDDGIEVGLYTDRDGDSHGFELDPKTGKIDELRPRGGVSVVPSGINDKGDIVGYLTTRGGSVESFIRTAGRFAKLSYPGAIKTEALGINQNDEVVGSYVDTSGATHGFLLSNPLTDPTWRSFDEPKARGVTVLTGINAREDLIGYYVDASGDRGSFVSLAAKRGPRPIVFPVWGYGGDAGFGPCPDNCDTDPGATPDTHLFAAVLDNSGTTSSSLASNCPGVSSASTCTPFKYTNLLENFCSTAVELAAYQYADSSDETAFLHTYANNISSSDRELYSPNPVATCAPDNPNDVMLMNPGDAAYNSWLYNNVWAGSNYNQDFPAPYGVMEDDTAILGGIPSSATEYGNSFANNVGNSAYADAIDFETAVGKFVNAACSSVCLPMMLNGVATGYGNIGACSVISNGHCFAGSYYTGVIDDQVAIDNICKTVKGGNLRAFMAERPIYSGVGGYGFLNSQTVTYEINTIADLYSHTADGCANTQIVDFERSYGPAGPGDVTGGYRIRTAALAFRWLVPNPATRRPDRVVSFQTTEDGTTSEAPYFFEDTLVPSGAEIPVAKFVWNGTTQTTGGGCPADGDTGGAVDLLVQCVGSAGIYCQEYRHLFINDVDYGRAAACLNTSTTNENIEPSWFKKGRISHYKYELSLQGGEMTSVPYEGVPGGSITMTTCTNTSYCTGQSSLSSQVAPFHGNGTDVLCGQCGVILLHRD